MLANLLDEMYFIKNDIVKSSYAVLKAMSSFIVGDIVVDHLNFICPSLQFLVPISLMDIFLYRIRSFTSILCLTWILSACVIKFMQHC